VKNTKKTTETIGLAATLNTFFAILISSIAALGQSGQTGTLIRDDLSHGLYGIGPAYTDYTVPDAGISPYLTLTARGADGGKAWIEDLGGKTTQMGKGGQGATVAATFRIGTNTGELKPGSKLRVIVGMAGASGKNCRGCIGRHGAGGGGGTGVLYLPSGADQTRPANWKILMVAGGGGGGVAGTSGISANGVPAQTTEQGFIPEGLHSIIANDAAIRNGGAQLDTVFGYCGNGGIDTPNAGAGGGTSFKTWKQEAGGASWGDGIESWVNDKDLENFGSPEQLMGETLNALAFAQGYENMGGHGLFQYVNGQILPVGGHGGSQTFSGGYGLGGGGASYKSSGFSESDCGGGAGGGYSGGWSGGDEGGGGGGSYVNSDYAEAGSIVKKQNGTTTDPQNGSVHYQFTSYGSASRPIAFNYGTQQEVTLLETGQFSLKWQKTGVLALFQGATLLWESNTFGKGATSLAFQGDGNLVIYSYSQAIWAAGTVGAKRMVLLPTGNLVVTNADGRQRWATNTIERIFSVSRPRTFEYKNVTQNVDLLKVGNYKLVWQTDGNLVLYEKYGDYIPCWTSNTNGKGANLLAFQGDGNMVIRNTNTNQTVWASWTNASGNGGKGGMKLLLTENGRAMINDADNKTIWSTPTYGFEKPVHIRYAANPNKALHQAAGSDGTGTNVVIQDELYSDQQYWMFDQKVIRLVSDPTMCLTVENGNLKIARFLRGTNQFWNFNEVDRTIRLVSDHNSCIDLNGNNSNPGTNVQIWPCNGSNAQKWVMY
jgi:hypothetical protein